MPVIISLTTLGIEHIASQAFKELRFTRDVKAWYTWLEKTTHLPWQQWEIFCQIQTIFRNPNTFVKTSNYQSYFFPKKSQGAKYPPDFLGFL
jgi:hypothetical protein